MGKFRNNSNLFGIKRDINIMRIIRISGTTSILSMSLLLLSLINPIYTYTEQVEATAGTATESTLTFTSTNTTASVNLSISSKTGTFATSGSNEKATFSISTNNYTGYTLTLKSTGSDTNLTSNNNNSITTLPSSTTYEVFSSSEATGQALNNRWGYIPNYYNSIANTTNYYPAPTNSDVAIINSTIAANSVDGVSNADTYTIGLGIRANYASAAGTYTNDTFILEYVANPINYSISFSDNTNDSSVENLPDTMNSSTSQTSITLPSTVPTRGGYTFNKWCLGIVSNDGITCTGTEYTSSASFGIDQTIDNTGITLYATWTKNLYDIIITADENVTSVSIKKDNTDTAISCTKNNITFTCSGLVYLDNYYLYPVFSTGYTIDSWFKNDNNINSSLSSTSDENAYYTVGQGDGELVLESSYKCIELPSGTGVMQTYSIDKVTLSSVCIGSTTVLQDNRDGKEYTVTRLGDGNIWLADNLALDLTDSTVVNTLSADNTNASATSLSYLKGTSMRDPEVDPDGNYATSGLTLSDWTSQDTYSYSAPMVNTTLKDNTTADDPISEASNWTYGVYYNYCAASAGSYCYGNGTSAGTTEATIIDEDICPAGWQIPTGGPNSNAQYKVLASSGYNGVGLYRRALHLPLSGNIHSSGSPTIQGEFGGWWSSTTLEGGSVYFLGVNKTGLATGDNTGRRNGYNVRCILKPRPSEQPTYIQDLTKNICQIAATQASYKVYDRRDGSDYTVRYIHGACWMTQNLRITGTVSSEDSNFNTYESVNVCEGELTSGNSYDEPRCHNSDNTTNGVWYNYVAATAKTITGNSNSATAAEDICPAGWHIPGYSTYYQAGFINSLSSTTETSKSLFSPITGGSYRNGASYGTSYGRWWSTTAHDDINRYGLYYKDALLQSNNGDYNRNYGLYIRCVRT